MNLYKILKKIAYCLWMMFWLPFSILVITPCYTFGCFIITNDKEEFKKGMKWFLNKEFYTCIYKYRR